MKAALARGLETGVLVQVKASYKLSAAAKKPPAKPKKVEPEKKKAPVKKKVSLGVGAKMRICTNPL